MLNDPILDQIRLALFRLDDYCFGVPTRGTGTDVGYEKMNGKVWLTINIENSRQITCDHPLRSIEEFYDILQNVGIMEANALIIEDPAYPKATLFSFSVPLEQASVAKLNKAHQNAVTDDIAKYYSNNIDVGEQKAFYHLGPQRGSAAAAKGLRMALNRANIGADMRAYTPK